MPTAKVLEVIDGKSLMIGPKWDHNDMAGFILILKNVETPARGEAGSSEAHVAHEKICTGKNISYEGDGIDMHRRLIAEVSIKGVSVNETMRELGYGT